MADLGVISGSFPPGDWAEPGGEGVTTLLS